MKNSFLLLILLSGLQAYGQHWAFGLGGSMGTFVMQDLKDLQDIRKQTAIFPVKTTENYPVTPGFQISFTRQGEGMVTGFGFFYARHSTGARSTVSDYSGRYDLDAVINGNQTGLLLEHVLDEFPFGAPGFYGNLSFSWSTLGLKDKFELKYPSKVTYQDKFECRSTGFSIEPGMFWQYRYGRFQIRLSMGYLFNHSGGLHLVGDKTQWLSVNNEKVRPDWSGLRMGCQVDFIFRNKKDDQNSVQ